MTSEDVIVAMIDSLNRLDVPFMLTGSLASNFYGVPRATMDADFVVELSGVSIDVLARERGNLLDPGVTLNPAAKGHPVSVAADRRRKPKSRMSPFPLRSNQV